MKRNLTACAASLALLAAAPAYAETVTYMTSHTFNIYDVQCARGVIGAACLDMVSPKTENGISFYKIDSAYGWNVQDFRPEELLPRAMDGIYAEGRIGNILDAGGNILGIEVQNQESADWKTGPLGGEWIKGLGALKTKAGTEHMVVLDHIMRDPSDPNPLQEGIDYNKRMKDDGKYLYFWGNYNQEPTPVYLYTRMPLPESWKLPGANYKITSAQLIIDHDITNSPNDQVRPEDFENENATGILPAYTICPTAPAGNTSACGGLPAGTWVSATASEEGGDGELLPVGTVLKALNSATGLFEYTNAWYTTLDRDPFGGPNPRFRLKSSKFGQDLPGVEIDQYEPGVPTTTTLDLLSIKNAATGLPVLADTMNWNNFVDEATDIFGNYDPLDGFSMEDCPLTQDLDLMLYIKGEVGKPTIIRKATLVVTYEGTSIPPAVPVDLAVSALSVPATVPKGESGTIAASVRNVNPASATGTLSVVGRDRNGNVVGNIYQAVTTPADGSAVTVTVPWTAPAYQTTVTWTATIANDNDADGSNNTMTAATEVIRLSDNGKGK